MVASNEEKPLEEEKGLPDLSFFDRSLSIGRKKPIMNKTQSQIKRI